VLGEALVGLVPEGNKPLRRSENLQRFTVGAEVNVAVAASRLGHRVSWIGRVGNDLAGDGVVDDLRREGVLLDQVRREPLAPTGILMREKTPLGMARVSYFRSGSAGSLLSEKDIDPSFVGSHSMAHVSGVTPALGPAAQKAAHAFLRVARETGVKTVFDLNYRSKLWSPKVAGPALAALAGLADIVIGGSEEWKLAFGTDELGDISLAPNTALVRTDGSNPVIALVQGRRITQETLTAQAVDVVGAGDAFVGGLLSALLADADWETALRQGTFCGARVVSSLGDWTNLPWGNGGLVEAPSNEQGVLR
jgi:2-dehydro-3-deoxygluconokinase